MSMLPKTLVIVQKSTQELTKFAMITRMLEIKFEVVRHSPKGTDLDDFWHLVCNVAHIILKVN